MCQHNFKKLNDLVNSYSEEEQYAEFPKGTLNRDIKDVLAHLHHWHKLLLAWYEVGMKGDSPDMPAKGYSWRQLPQLNKEIREKYKDVSLKSTRKMLKESYAKTQDLIKRLSDKELFAKKRYHWTGSKSLASYLISNTSSHYSWAI